MADNTQTQVPHTDQSPGPIVVHPSIEYPLLAPPHLGPRRLPDSLFVRTFRRRWRLMLVVFTLLLAVGFALSIIFIHPTYQAVVQLHFVPHPGIDNTLIGGDARRGYSGYLATQLRLIPRRDIVSAAVRELALAPPSAVEDLMARTSVVLQDRGQMVSVLVSGSSPDGLVEAANAVADTYRSLDILPKIRDHKQATQPLRDELASLRQDRTALLNTLSGRNNDPYIRALYRRQKNLAQQLAETKRDLDDAQSEYNQAAARLAALSASNVDPQEVKAILVGLTDQDPLLQMYRSIYRTMIAASDQDKLFSETDARKVLKKDSKTSALALPVPAGSSTGSRTTIFEQINQGMAQRLEQLQSQAFQEAEKLRRATIATQQAVLAQKDQLRQAKDKFFRELLTEDDKIEQEITQVPRLAGQVRDLDDRIASSLEQLQIKDVKMLPPAEPVLAERAVMAAKINDFRWLALAASALLAGLLALSGGLLVEHFDSRLTNAGDIVRRVGIPVLASLPTSDDQRTDDFWLPEEMSMADYVNDQYRNIRTAVLFGQSATPHLIVVTAPTTAETKTTLSVNLAISIARSGRTVLLVDADLDNPALADVFDLPASPGFSDALRNPASLSQAICRTRVERLSVMPAGSQLEHSAELLSSPSGRSLIDSLAQAFEHVIIDAPPLLDCPEGRIVAALADGVICSFSARSTRSGQARQATAVLEELGAAVIGSVLNA